MKGLCVTIALVSLLVEGLAQSPPAIIFRYKPHVESVYSPDQYSGSIQTGATFSVGDSWQPTIDSGRFRAAGTWSIAGGAANNAILVQTDIAVPWITVPSKEAGIGASGEFTIYARLNGKPVKVYRSDVISLFVDYGSLILTGDAAYDAYAVVGPGNVSLTHTFPLETRTAGTPSLNFNGTNYYRVGSPILVTGASSLTARPVLGAEAAFSHSNGNTFISAYIDTGTKPVATFDNVPKVSVGTSVSLYNKSFDPDDGFSPLVGISNVSWSTTGSVISSDPGSIQIQWNTPGIQFVYLTVTDDEGMTATTVRVVKVVP